MRRKLKPPQWLRDLLLEDQFELFIAFLCMISGLPLIFQAAAAPSSLEALLPVAVVRLWGATLCIGGTVICVGIFLRHINRRRLYFEGLMIEAAGLLPLGAATLVLSIVAFYVQGMKVLFGALIYLSFTGACASRFWAITLVMRALRTAMTREQGAKRECE